jgi:hypothetical protein
MKFTNYKMQSKMMKLVTFEDREAQQDGCAALVKVYMINTPIENVRQKQVNELRRSTRAASLNATELIKIYYIYYNLRRSIRKASLKATELISIYYKYNN